MTKTEALLINIARCDNFINHENVFSENGEMHPCKTIVNLQKGRSNRQLPEPWNGDIENSAILFISSNPSINESEHYPLESWRDEEIIDFFKNRFSNLDYVKNYLYPKLRHEFANEGYADPEGYYKSWVRYWGYVRSISRVLLDRRDIVPGNDYALMEVVRCKSKDEKGVTEAMNKCAGNYLLKTLSLSNAKVIVAVGDKAKEMLASLLKIDFKTNYHIEKEIGGRKRMIFATPHSNSRKKRTLDFVLDVRSIKEIKERLSE